MYDYLHGLLQDREGGAVFGLYNFWHFLYLILLFGGIFLTVYLLRKKPTYAKKAVDWSLNFALILYIADFFLMPFSYGYIDIDKLPFHLCTLMSVLCFMGRHNPLLARFKCSFTLLALIGALMYVFCPSGVADGEVSIICYRVTQTLWYHGALIAYGVFALCFGDVRLKWKQIYRELYVIVLLVVWSVLGNIAYAGVEDGRTFNWFFVRNDPFGILPEQISAYIMPLVMTAVIFAMVMLIYLIYTMAVGLLHRKSVFA